MANKTEQELMEQFEKELVAYDSRLAYFKRDTNAPDQYDSHITYYLYRGWKMAQKSAASVGEGVPTPDDYVRLSAVMYQVAGVHNASVEVMDLLSAAQNQEPFSHMLDSALPYVVSPASATSAFKAWPTAYLKKEWPTCYKDLLSKGLIERDEFDQENNNGQ